MFASEVTLSITETPVVDIVGAWDLRSYLQVLCPEAYILLCGDGLSVNLSFSFSFSSNLSGRMFVWQAWGMFSHTHIFSQSSPGDWIIVPINAASLQFGD